MKITESVINRLFYVMKEKYGSYWVIMIGNDPIANIKTFWMKELSEYTAENIGKTLGNIKDLFPERPPNIHQFKSEVQSLKHGKSGHESYKSYQQEPVYKVSKKAGNNYLDKIRGDLGQKSAQQETQQEPYVPESHEYLAV